MKKYKYINGVKHKATLTAKEVARQLIDGLEDEYTPEKIKFIEKRLKEISEMEKMTLEELNEYCWANSLEMFACIFDYKVFDKENFEID